MKLVLVKTITIILNRKYVTIVYFKADQLDYCPQVQERYYQQPWEISKHWIILTLQGIGGNIVALLLFCNVTGMQTKKIKKYNIGKRVIFSTS